MFIIEGYNLIKDISYDGVKMSKFKTWFENYWYHYKWVTIITVFFSIALIVCFTQCTKKQEYDMYALYAGPYYIGADESQRLSDSINDHMDAEKQEVCINSFVYVSEKTKEEYKKGDAYVNEGINMQQTSDFFDFLYTANFNMLILDPELYSRIEKKEILTPISDISDVYSEDGYCVKLSDTDLPKKYKVFSDMPSDTVLCFRKYVLIQSMSAQSSKPQYEYQMSIFKKMIEG